MTKTLLFSLLLALLAPSAIARAADPAELRDPAICTSRDADFIPQRPSQPSVCSAPRGPFGKRIDLRVSLVAKQRPVSVPRVGANGQIDTEFSLLNAYTYMADPDRPGQGSIVPPVLRVDRGDTLKFHLENDLPALEDGAPQVTNLHTHGLVVSPRGNADNVFILINPKSAANAPAHAGAEMHQGFFDYAINVPRERINMPGNNPSQSRAGLFWFHPHPHGLSQRQLAHGLSGLLAVGSVGEYADCLDAKGNPISCDKVRRHFMMLRDFIVEEVGGGWNIVERNPDKPVYCDTDPLGNCAGEPGQPRRKWLFTVNGMVKPMLHMQPGETRLIRLGNVGADVTYKLDIVSLDGSVEKPSVQLIAKDGIGVAGENPLPLLLMPASRVEFMLTVPARGGHWLIRTIGHNTGGDTWPVADLIDVVVPQAVATAAARKAVAGAGVASVSKVEMKEPLRRPDVELRPLPEQLKRTLDGLLTRTVRQTDGDATAHAAHEHHLEAAAPAAASGPDPCAYKRLKGEQRRVVTFAQDEETKTFKIGYAITEPGKETVTLADPRPVEMTRTDVCVGTGAEETWEIVNAAGEIHNFHIHQSKYMVAGVIVKDASDCSFINLPPGQPGPDGPTCDIKGVAGAAGHDTFPVPPGGRLTIRIAFKNYVQRGKFVFHCHLLEHEDHGMMAILELKD